ncbi:MAG: diaminopimelate epimerase [Bacteroidetes bacterium]|nr:diaminopimelate epimerase [Fibrella sp.]
MEFVKYQGTGNDFVLIDDRSETFPADDQAFVAHLCHRRFGIGADGLILLRTDPDYDFRMIYFNADGAEGSMCGNGGRCIVRFAHDLGLFEGETRFRAVDGEHRAEVRGDDIFLRMGDVSHVETHPNALWGDETPSVSYFLQTGSPHVVTFTDALDSLDVVGEGRAIRYAKPYQPGGTNVNFTEVLGDNRLFVRTYERGVEDETYSCGTGVTAAALATRRQFGMAGPVFIQTRGGELRIAFDELPDGSFTNVYLIGPAKRVFSGQLIV